MKSQSRRKFLKTLGSAAVSTGSLSLLSGLGATNCGPKERKRPNVVLVMTDDQGYGDLGCHGSPYVKTPALDRLYDQSVRLTDFHADPCCSPTRASLLTGQYSARTGVWHTIGGRSLLQKDKPTMADIFQANGYRTGIFGKWHLGDNYPFRPQDRGFQETVVHGGGTVGANPDRWGNDYYDDTYVHNGKLEHYEGYCNSVWFDEAIRFIRQNRDRPFFCYLPTNLPHAPLNVDEKYAAPYRSQVSERLANYYGMLTKFDEDMARLVQEIGELSLEENTILIFMTDNGPCPWYGGIIIDDDGFVVEGYSAGMRGGKIWGYENAHRVPCFIRWPAGGLGGGRDADNLAAHFDLLPTLVDACSLEMPEPVDFDGKSLMPLLQSPDIDWPERILIVHNQRVDFPTKYKDYQVLTERWRLVKRKTEELYDIVADPGERNDIADKHPDVVEALRERYETWWADVSRDFDKYPEIIIGSARENPATLYAHDAHRKDRERIWVVHVDREGEYRINVSRWPREADKRIVENRQGDRTVPITSAQLKIGNIDLSVPVSPDMKEAEFTVRLKAGTTCFQGWFTEEITASVRNAECIYVERVGPADREALARFQPSDPDRLIKE